MVIRIVFGGPLMTAVQLKVALVFTATSVGR